MHLAQLNIARPKFPMDSIGMAETEERLVHLREHGEVTLRSVLSTALISRKVIDQTVKVRPITIVDLLRYQE